jgi:large subunit ribosomal protein L10
LETLRANLKKADAQLKVVKNTLLRIAAKDTAIERINDLFDGPTAVAICEKDATAVAKVFVESLKKLPLLRIKGGIVEGSVIGESQISDLEAPFETGAHFAVPGAPQQPGIKFPRDPQPAPVQAVICAERC